MSLLVQIERGVTQKQNCVKLKVTMIFLNVLIQYILYIKPGAIARSVVMSLGDQEAPRSILASGTSFREDLVMKLFLRPFFLFR